MGTSVVFRIRDFLKFLSSGKYNSGKEAYPYTQSSKASSPERSLWIIPQTHWEGAVFLTREQYLEKGGLGNILAALRLLNDFPDYRFTLDQVCYVKPFLERYPEAVVAFRQFVDEGRLQIVGGTHTQLDVNMPCGESIIRQMLYGKSYFRKKLGVEVTVGFNCDAFGHNAQMPQLLKLAGYKSNWIWMGVPNSDTPSEFLWQGIDGTQIATFIPGGIPRPPSDIDDFISFIKKQYDSLSHLSHGTDRVCSAGGIFTDPLEIWPVMVKKFYQRDDKPLNLRLAVPTDFEAAMEKRPDRQVIKGELNPIFQGAYSSRIELKQKLRYVERLLITAEKLAVIGDLLGKPTSDEKVWSAWEPSMFNQAHDLMSGVMTDPVYEDTIKGYDFSTSLGKELVEERLDYLTSQIDTTGEGIPLVIFNSLGWVRDDVVETVVGFKRGGIADIQVVDQSNTAIPLEILEAERFRDGGLKNARIIFIATKIAAMGHAVYRIIPLSSASELNAGRENSKEVLENEFYKVKVDLSTGAMTSLELKSLKWEVLDKAGNIIVHQYDGGGLWTLYEDLKIDKTVSDRKQPVPLESIDQFSTEYGGEHGEIHQGPVYSEYKLAPHRFGAEGALSIIIRTYTGLRRIEIRSQIQNNEKFVRYQVMFPTTIKNGRVVHEIPFGSIERPNGIEFPAQNWADYSDGEKGLTLLNRGLPGNLTSDSTMILSLMRSAVLGPYSFGGGFENGMSSDTGLMLNKEIEFEYAVVPHTGDWCSGEAYRHGFEYNNPLLCRKAGSHEGILPKAWGALEVSEPNVVITAFKQAGDGSTILRLYEASGKATPVVTLSSKLKISSANEANLIEDTGKKLKVVMNKIQFGLGPFEIKTFKLKLKG
jgi:alpha-mannosidase